MLEHAFAPGRRARVGPPIRGYATVVAALLGPALGLAATGARRGDELYVVHLLAVGVTMLIATAAAAALVRAGRRRDDARSVAVGVAFSFMGALLLLHALATPNVLGPDENGLIAFTGGAALPTGALVLGLVGSPWLRSARAIPRLLRVQAVVLAAVALVGIVGFADPGIVPAEPAPHSPPALALLAVSCLLFARIATRAWRTYALTRRPADLAAVVGVAWLGTALVAALLWHAWSLGWWVSHGLEAAGMAGVAAPVALDLRRAAPSRALSGGLAATELVHREEYLLGPQVHALLERLAQADRSTEEHTRRVALLAVQVGEHLGLPPARLRRLALGGLLHDIGKLSTPPEILGKPGPLTEEEFAVVQRHPADGDRLAAALGLPGSVRALIRSHHERLDGTGYPDGLGAGRLSLDVRVLAVCDVFDALTSDRPYRPALGSERAFAILAEQVPDGLDGRCVAALRAVVGGAERLDAAA